MFTGIPALCVALRVRCPEPFGSCSPVCPLVVLGCVCCVLSHLDPVHRCARSLRCSACAVSWATWLLFTGAPAPYVALLVRCRGHLAPVHRCARLVRCLRMRCPRQTGSCSPVCPPGVLCCVCGVGGPLSPVHRCVRSVRRVACTVSWAPWLLFTVVPARCAVFACAVSWAIWLLFTGLPARCVLLRVRCPGPFGSVHRCARSVCCAVCCVCGGALRGAHSSIRTAAVS